MVQGGDALKALEGLSALWQVADRVGEGEWNEENQQEDVYGSADESLALRSVRGQRSTSLDSSREAYIGSV
jgi:hypothetical protein